MPPCQRPSGGGGEHLRWMGADVSALSPDAPHSCELEFPALAPGQFQGLFLDNVEVELTSEIVPGD
jgi:hypothetical protein